MKAERPCGREICEQRQTLWSSDNGLDSIICPRRQSSRSKELQLYHMALVNSREIVGRLTRCAEVGALHFEFFEIVWRAIATFSITNWTHEMSGDT